MKIAIHHRPGSFSDRWIAYCEDKRIPYKIVNAYNTDIVKQVEDCDAFMWHHHHTNYKDTLFAKQLLYSLETAGKRVFPDFHTGWHFDDKVGQKYLLEAIGAPLVPSYVFYSKGEALAWAKQTSYPKVFKLSGGASSANVCLVRSQQEAIRLIKKAFGKGFSQYNRWGNLRERFKKWRQGKETFISVCKGIARLFILSEFAKLHGSEKGYIYFQDFVPQNTYDIRVIIIDNKAIAIKRMCRPNDFRASGSGRINYDPNEIDIRCVKQSFDIANRLSDICVGFDWIFDLNKEPMIVEMSYGFSAYSYDLCPGYWTEDLHWHTEKIIPQNWMIEAIIK